MSIKVTTKALLLQLVPIATLLVLIKGWKWELWNNCLNYTFEYSINYFRIHAIFRGQFSKSQIFFVMEKTFILVVKFAQSITNKIYFQVNWNQEKRIFFLKNPSKLFDVIFPDFQFGKKPVFIMEQIVFKTNKIKLILN